MVPSISFLFSYLHLSQMFIVFSLLPYLPLPISLFPLLLSSSFLLPSAISLLLSQSLICFFCFFNLRPFSFLFLLVLSLLPHLLSAISLQLSSTLSFYSQSSLCLFLSVWLSHWSKTSTILSTSLWSQRPDKYQILPDLWRILHQTSISSHGKIN